MKKVILGTIVMFALIGIQVEAATAMAPRPTSGGGSGQMQKQEDNRPFSVAAIRACVATAIPTTSSTTATTITKAKGESLQTCIKNARQTVASGNSALIAELLRKVEELRVQIAAMKASLDN